MKKVVWWWWRRRRFSETKVFGVVRHDVLLEQATVIECEIERRGEQFVAVELNISEILALHTLTLGLLFRGRGWFVPVDGWREARNSSATPKSEVKMWDGLTNVPNSQYGGKSEAFGGLRR